MSSEAPNSAKTQFEVMCLGVEHLKGCVELDKVALNGMWSSSLWLKELADPQRICLGISRKTNLIALACGWLVVDELDITAIAVHPKHRNRGLGRIVLSELLRVGHKKGAIKATLEVRSSNLPAQALYESCGFITTGRRNKYYKCGADSLIQWKELKENQTPGQRSV